ncbi:slipin family protein [Flavonifractor hominis]|uniref:Slipin family protein n=1 Tax=Flavonifractor hominis TaxID=3133178 RepID=A0ABV1ENG5_9FIRM
MKKIVINDNQRGLLFQSGRFVKPLGSGKYRVFGSREIEVLPLDAMLTSEKCPLDILLSNPAVAEQTTVVEVGDQQLGLHFTNGRFAGVLPSGKFAFWHTQTEHTVQLIDLSSPAVAKDVPDYVLEMLPASCCERITVEAYQKGRLYFDRKLERILDPGTYYFWKTHVPVSVELIDTRLTQLNITGQEILTSDKVNLRLNFVCTYRITDCVKVATEIDDYLEQLHVAAQLAMREFVGKQRLDELLENKEQLSRQVLSRLQEKAASLYVEITDGGVKDIILPGEVRDIMNTVLIAEKRAQANVITRREEVASTRSLLNTARLMEENQTLMRLKEMEYMERICENVGSIHLNGGGDLLAQLGALLQSG